MVSSGSGRGEGAECVGAGGGGRGSGELVEEVDSTVAGRGNENMLVRVNSLRSEERQ